MSESVEILFKLLRIALGSEEMCDLPSGINWKEVVDLSFDQGVAAIAVDGLGFAHDNLNQEWMKLIKFTESYTYDGYGEGEF